ncbi:MAG TPA: SpoIIE family protein phosphatase [Gemmataceae bacterium]|nr:SpoIIE family protein phosphatase [Gemmataceae bacterium]
MTYLLVLKGPNAKQTYPLDKDRVLLGRNSNCDIVFPANDFAISREHACILRQQDKFFIEDMGSRNGTFVNNTQIQARLELKDSDKIRICDFLYSFHDTKSAVRHTPIPPLPEEPKADPDEGESITFEASLSSTNSHVLLEAQPAEKIRALIDITNNLSNTLELDSLLPKIVDSLFQLFKQADRGFIILREEAIERDKPVERLIPKVIKTRRPQNETATSYSRSIVRECLKTVQAFLSDDAAQDQRWNMSQSIADFRIRSVMCAPLWTQDNKAFGVIQLDTQDRSKKFTQEDLGLLMAVAKQASVAMENAQLHTELLSRERLRRDMELAQQVQMSFLPRELPVVPGYEFYAYYEPAQEVGGDYYGFIPIQASRMALLLGDVAGKGIPAALLMAKLSSDARFSLMSESKPGRAISVLNDLLYQNTSQMDRFVTLAAALLDMQEHTVTFVNAGHPSPLLLRHATGELERCTSRDFIGLPLGVMEGFPYECREMKLEPGDSVLIFSDGVTEAMDKQNNLLNDKAFEMAVQEGVRGAKPLGERVVKLVKQHAAGRGQSDDITLVSFGRLPPG